MIGITGQGKSKLLEHLLVQDIVAGRGCGLLDPHTDLARDLLANLAVNGFFDNEQNNERVIYFDPSRTDYLVPFNVLSTDFSPYTTASNCVEAFRRTWPESLKEAPRFTNILTAALLTLISNRLTLVELPRLLTDNDFRETLLQHVDDYEVISVFRDRLDKWGRDQPLILESILNKVGALMLNPILKAILGQRENQLNFRKMMDDETIFIADLGRCDGETRKLLGSLIVTGIEQAALSRKDTAIYNRKPFYFYIDEFQDFVANEGSIQTLSQILSEARKFGLHLTLAHQTLGQMNYERMRSALGNVGTKVVFNVDRDDAEIMAKKLFSVGGEGIKHEVSNAEAQNRSHPVFYSLNEQWEKAIQSIQNLKPRTCYVKTQHKTVAYVHTMPIPDHHVSEENLDNIRHSLVKRLGKPVSEAKPMQSKRSSEWGSSHVTDYEVAFSYRQD